MVQGAGDRGVAELPGTGTGRGLGEPGAQLVDALVEVGAPSLDEPVGVGDQRRAARDVEGQRRPRLLVL